MNLLMKQPFSSAFASIMEVFSNSINCDFTKIYIFKNTISIFKTTMHNKCMTKQYQNSNKPLNQNLQGGKLFLDVS